MPSTYRDLIVWRKSMRSVVEVYRATEAFPKREWYGLAAQVRRAAVSVPSNIAEGQGRRHKREFQQFLGTARGSLMEVETQLLLARALHYIEKPTTDALLGQTAEIGRMLNGLMVAMKN